MTIGFRRVSVNGRVSVPAKIRRELNIREEDLVEISVDGDSIVLKKYVPEEKLIDALSTFQSRFEIESVDLKYKDAMEIEKHINEIRMILEKRVEE